MTGLRSVVADGNVLELVKRFLAAGVMEDGVFYPTTVGTGTDVLGCPERYALAIAGKYRPMKASWTGSLKKLATVSCGMPTTSLCYASHANALKRHELLSSNALVSSGCNSDPRKPRSRGSWTGFRSWASRWGTLWVA